jgi:hypothetical protein
MTRIIALMALTTLGLSGAPVHESVHAEALLSAHPVTVSNAVCWRLAYARERARQSWADGLDRPLPYMN